MIYDNEVFNKHADFLNSTLKDYVDITPRLVKNGELKLWESNINGLPYMPKDFEYPENSEGRPLFLLAQINFAEVPRLEFFPENGILQFYISDDEDYGRRLDDDKYTEQDNFRVIYFPEINEKNLITDFSFLPKRENYLFQYYDDDCTEADNDVIKDDVSKFEAVEYALKFETKQMLITASEINGIDYVNNLSNDDADELIDALYNDKHEHGHRIGGYPRLVQGDPRDLTEFEDKKILLFQIDGDSEESKESELVPGTIPTYFEPFFGDCGAANFFISKKDLLKKDFSDVIYDWAGY